MKFTLALVVVALMAMSLAAAQEEEFGDALSEKVLADRAQIDQVLEAVGVTNVDELLKTHEENTARITQLESMVTASEGRLAKLKSAAEIGVANVDVLLKKEHESLDRITELEAIVSASEKKHGKLKLEAQAAVEESSDQLSQYRSELELLKQASSLEMQRVQAELAAAVGELGACQSKPETPESMTVTCPDFADMRGEAELQECSVEFKRAYHSCSDYVKQSSKTYSATVGAAALHAAIIASDYTVDALSVTKMWTTDVAIPGTIAGVGNFGKAFFKTTGNIWESSIKPVVGPSYDEHARQHVDVAVAQLYAFYKEHVAPVLFPVIRYHSS
jgi:hypothetical protein